MKQHNYFRLDNTEGYSSADLKILNREFDKLMKDVDTNDPNYEDIKKSTGNKVKEMVDIHCLDHIFSI